MDGEVGGTCTEQNRHPGRRGFAHCCKHRTEARELCRLLKVEGKAAHRSNRMQSFERRNAIVMIQVVLSTEEESAQEVDGRARGPRTGFEQRWIKGLDGL